MSTGQKASKRKKIHKKTAHCDIKNPTKLKKLSKNHHASTDALFFRGSLA